jgi:hypothetical protein
MIDPDGFYHAEISALMSRGQLIFAEFPWMQFSTLQTNFTDHHFLYHALLIPFVLIFPPLIGAKIATVILTAGFLTLLF